MLQYNVLAQCKPRVTQIDYTVALHCLFKSLIKRGNTSTDTTFQLHDTFGAEEGD